MKGSRATAESRKRAPTKLMGGMLSLAYFWATKAVPQMNAVSSNSRSACRRFMVFLISGSAWRSLYDSAALGFLSEPLHQGLHLRVLAAALRVHGVERQLHRQIDVEGLHQPAGGELRLHQ